MRFVLLGIFFLFTLPATVASAPFDEARNIQQQYEEFRRFGDTDSHQAINSDDDLAEAYLLYGQKAFEAGDAETAINYFNAGRELRPDDGRFSMMLGLVYARIEDKPLAEMNLLEAIRLLPEAMEPRQMLADHYYRSGQLSEAEELLAKLKQLNPDDKDIANQLQQVQREIGVETDMVSDVNSIFSIKFDDQVHSEIADKVVAILQDAYAEQGSLLNFYPQKNIQIILYSRADYDMTTGAPAWSAGRFDGKIRIPISRHTVQHANLNRILAHEYNHFLAQQLSRGRAPAWFYEGLAMVAESRPSKSTEHFSAAERAGELFDFAILKKSFNHLDQASALLAYEQSYSFVSYLVSQFGWHTMKDLLIAFSDGLTVEKAFASVFNDFGLDYGKLQSEWLASQ